MISSSDKEKRSGNGILGFFDSSLSITYRIMSIIAFSGAVANTIGFLANYLLYGMTLPSVFCGICDVLTVLYLFFGLRSKHYILWGYALLSVLTVLEFPLLTLSYGAIMLPYMVLGFMVWIMLTKGKSRYITGFAVGIYYLAVIIIGMLTGFMKQEVDVSGLLGSAVVTFTVSVIALTFCTITWQNVYLKDTVDIDGITGKFSRSGFFRKAAKLIRNAPSEKYSLLYFDIRSFKAANTVFGTVQGNEILRQMGEYLSTALFNPHLVGRIEADRFICLADTAVVNEEALSDFCRLNCRIGEKSVGFSLSYGIYVITNPAEDIRQMCDKASSVIKFVRVGQNKTVAKFDEKMEEAFRSETRTLEDVENAIANREFEPFYQPIVDCKTGEIVSAEALARWIRSENGIVSPGVFIPILEKKEMISDLDMIIISKVHEFLKKRHKENKSVLPISSNLSRVDLFNPSLINKLREMVCDVENGRTSLRFEVTESALISLPDSVFDILSELRSEGASISVDDFGNGYSSLGMISSFDFDIIKLDKQFADRIEESEKNRGVIKSVIELSHYLHAKVVCEGVETASQVKFLRECGCDYIQGFYFYRPMKEADFAALLDSQK